MLDALPSGRFTREMAAHLLNRAGFGGSPAEVDRLAAMGLDKAVDWLVDYESQPDVFSLPAWTTPDPQELAFRRTIPTLPQDQKKEANQTQRQTFRQREIELHGWWLERMRATQRPLQEKMTLFWHALFATSIQKVNDPYMMWVQNETFRRNATGQWGEILIAMAKDPAMLVWLDGAQNRKRAPNENFAREVMELFTLGEGHYTEKDIKESARAFAGWGVDRIAGTFEDRPFQHDLGVKRYLGHTGLYSGEDILRILAETPRSGQYVWARLWRYFATEEPNPELTDALAARFAKEGGQFKPVLKVLFSSQEFYAPNVVRQQVKAPVQWLVSTCRVLERPLPPRPSLMPMMRMLGQVLFAPPSVKGWDTGTSWIGTNTLLDRYNFAALFVQGSEKAMPRRFDGERNEMMSVSRASLQPYPDPGSEAGIEPEKLFTPEEMADSDKFLAALVRRLVSAPVGEGRMASLRAYVEGHKAKGPDMARGAVRLLMSTPDFQLT
ncbi:MAG TPA: DUF1800 domain-containing protein [Candidatus Methylacidiphilales bacterium]